MSRFYIVAWAFAYCILCVGCHTNSDDMCPDFVFELRMPKAQTPDPQTRIELASARGSDATNLSACKQTEERDSVIYQRDFLLFDEPSARRALIVSLGSPTQDLSQVFTLSIPRNPKPRDFSHWQRPNYVGKGDVGWAIIYKQKVRGASTNIPPGCFELRYKIKMVDLGSD